MNINTLIPDIYHLVEKRHGDGRARITPEVGTYLSEGVRHRIMGQFGEQSVLGTNSRSGTLRLSQMGPRCPRALWHSIHKPELAETLPPWAEIKYAYGHIIEAFTLALAKAAGHEVVGEQDEIVVDGIVGHRDAVIDGYLVDVKSASNRSFGKFANGTLAQDDLFGYLDQLDGYLLGSYDDPLVRYKDTGYLFVVDKSLGHMVLYKHVIREARIKERIRVAKEIVALDRPPPCTCQTVPIGESGNIGLGVRASYEQFKYECFPHLRTFIYARGPVYLTYVKRKPEVPEIDRYGNLI